MQLEFTTDELWFLDGLVRDIYTELPQHFNQQVRTLEKKVELNVGDLGQVLDVVSDLRSDAVHVGCKDMKHFISVEAKLVEAWKGH